MGKKVKKEVEPPAKDVVGFQIYYKFCCIIKDTLYINLLCCTSSLIQFTLRARKQPQLF